MKKTLLIMVLLLATLVVAAPPPQAEKDFFEELGKRFDKHKDLAPLPVEEARGTIAKELEITFDCPNPPPQKGKVKVKTKLVAWAGQSGEAGHYDWKCSIEVDDEEKLMECDNEISIDLGKMKPENSFSKQADNVRIYYHEWLHSQLLLNAMKTAEWQKKFCSCTVDLDPADLDDPHKIIPKLDVPFKEKLLERILTLDNPWDISFDDTTEIPEFTVIGAGLALILSIFFIFRKK